MEVAQIADGLWRWTGRRESIGADVACVYQEGPDGVVLIDPLIPPEDDERFLAALDRDVARAGGAVHVLVTVSRHQRSAAALVERYGAERRAATEALPNGIVALGTGDAAEVAYWLPTHSTVVFGDAVRGRGVVLEMSRPIERSAGDALLALPAEHVLVSHGEPVLDSARAALRTALSPRRAA